MPKRLREVLPHAVMLGVAVLLYWAATRIEAPTGGRIGPSAWPKAIIVIMGLLCAYELVKRLVLGAGFTARGLLSSPASPAAQKAMPAPPEVGDHAKLAGGVALIAAYVVAVPWTGFFATTAVFLAAFPWIGGWRRPVVSAVVGLAGAFALVVVFMRVAYISLPLGEGPFRALSIGLMRAIGVT